jgi:hypothetical protein
MDLDKVNFFLDKFLTKMEGLKVWLTPYGQNSYLINLEVQPEKMLQRSPEYNFDYAQKIMTISPLDLEDLVYNALRYTGQDTSINLTSYETHLSEDLGIYLENYLEDVSELLPNFIDSEYAPRKLKKNTKDLNVKYFLMDITLTNTKNKLFIPFKGMTDQGPLYRSVNVSTLSGLLDYLEENGLNDPQVIVYID